MTLSQTYAEKVSLSYENDVSTKYIKDEIIHILIPAYNEAKSISNVVEQLYSGLKDNYNFRVTIIDDGSTDNTYEILSKIPYPLEIVQNEKNFGKGRTLRRAIELCNEHEIVIMLDADGEHLPSDIPELLKPILLRKADIVIGSRFISQDLTQKNNKGSYLKNGKQFSRLRQLGNNLFSMVILLLFKVIITDSQSGFRVFGKNVLNKMQLQFSGFELETELTLLSIKQNLKIVEIPIHSGLSTRESHMNIIRDSLKIIGVILLYKFPKFTILKRLFY